MIDGSSALVSQAQNIIPQEDDAFALNPGVIWRNFRSRSYNGLNIDFVRLCRSNFSPELVASSISLERRLLLKRSAAVAGKI